MRKIFVMLCAIALTSCNNGYRDTTSAVEKEGFAEGKTVVINGKEYKFLLVEPHPAYRNVWILIPKSDTVKVPVSVNYEIREGKRFRNQTVIKID